MSWVRFKTHPHVSNNVKNMDEMGDRVDQY